MSRDNILILATVIFWLIGIGMVLFGITTGLISIFSAAIICAALVNPHE